MREITHDQFSRAILDGIDAAQAVSHKAFTTEEVIALQDHRYETDTTVIGSYSIVENDKRHDCPLRATGIATRNRPPYLHEPSTGRWATSPATLRCYSSSRRLNNLSSVFCQGSEKSGPFPFAQNFCVISREYKKGR
jgi:hypothetical protein